MVLNVIFISFSTVLYCLHYRCIIHVKIKCGSFVDVVGGGGGGVYSFPPVHPRTRICYKAFRGKPDQILTLHYLLLLIQEDK
jgi:hypothetical protein